MNIRDVSRKYGISMDTLRYYEKMELIGKTERAGNRRIYEEKECKELEFIMIARDAGLPIDILKKYMIANRDENIDIPEKKELLKEEIEYIKENMRKEQLFLNKLNSIVDKYDKILIARDEKERERIEREKTREFKKEQERIAKEKAKEEARLARERKKEELRLQKLQERLERKRAKKKLAGKKDEDEDDD
ncbi:MAG: MerR family transcriptional regulator [Clostridia bacterium]|nr:MerR family transcriptional regulator [Clostridia bacterium]